MMTVFVSPAAFPLGGPSAGGGRPVGWAGMLLAGARAFVWSMARAGEDGRPSSASTGPAERFNQQVLPHLDGAYNLARFLARDVDAAEDIVQEACLRAFRSFGDFRGGSPRAWLFAIVRNCHYDWRGERGRDAGRAAVVPGDGEDEGFDLDRLEADIDDPETALLRRSEAEAVRAVLRALPEMFREILVLRELEDLSYREIAEVSAIPIGTVMSRLARARSLFEALWRRHAARTEARP